jgi:hypothetical protein
MREAQKNERIPINHLVGIVHGVNEEDIFFGYVRKITEDQTGTTYFIQTHNGGEYVQHTREQIMPVVLKPENYSMIRD